MATEFTKDQQKAIETLDKSVLVSAAAGSGKTSVLVQRIISIILEGKANVDEMLVVTFTNAAASEMRLRLSNAIRKRMKDHPEDASRMREQLSRLYRAYISTIDSFATRVIREFFYEIDMEPEFGVADEVQSELMKREAVAELLEEAFENDGIVEGGSFKEFMRLYGEERSDERFSENLIKSYDALRTMPEYFSWAREKAENLRISMDSFDGSELQRVIGEDALAIFESASNAMRKVRSIMDDAGAEAIFERKLKDEDEAIHDIYSRLKEDGLSLELIDSIKALNFASMHLKNDEKEIFEPIKQTVKEIREALKNDIRGFTGRYLSPDLESRLSELAATYDYTVYYIGLLEEFERRFSEKKREKRLMDFSDISHTAVKILQNDDAAETLRRRFKFVFVDEYQDTNNIQEYLIGKVSSPQNVFKVGDIKQSIYKFRLAEPEIFERLYREYSSLECEDGIVINLSKNFRTNDNTIKYINHVFEHVMEGYDENARLNTGVDCPAEYDFKPEVHVLIKQGSEEDDYPDDDMPDASAAVDAMEEMTKDEAESEYIAELAAGIIGTEFYDTKRGEVRKAEARDIAILMRSVKFSGEQIAAALAARSVDSHIEETEDYFDTLEINIALSILSCIDNMKRDLPLIATLHSEVFDFGPKDLAEIRIAYREEVRKSTPYWEAFKWYAQNGRNDELKERVVAASEQILEWRRLSRIMPLSDFIWKVLVDSGYYRACGAMSGGGRRQANLRALADRALAFSKDGIASLSSFISFVEVMKSKKISNGQPPMAGKDDDLVRISTMHKSKGLEYPFVIVGGLGRKFNRDNNEKKFTFDSKVGVGMPYIDPSRKYWRNSILQKAMKASSDRDSYKEDLRLLYVDMTRARNKLYLVGSTDSEESLMKYGKPNCYLKVLRDFIKTPYNEYFIRPLPKANSSDRRRTGRYSIEKDIALGPEAELMYKEIDERFSFEYPNAGLLSAKSKYSVSAIRREELALAEADSEDAENADAANKTDAEIVKLWDRSEKKKKASASDIGIAYHRIMEFTDFARAVSEDGSIDRAYIKERAEHLRDHDAIEADVYESLELEKIAGFFESDIGRRAVKASNEGSLKKEKAFTLKTERDGRDILVQGVIDCCFEEDGSLVLIDYKSSFVKSGRDHDAELERIKKEYKVQIELYSEAAQKGTGLKVSEAYLYLFQTGEALRI